MIITEFYNGQGLGNQLWSYVVTRAIAEKNGYKYGIMHPENFKGHEFLKLDFGETVEGGSGPEGGPPLSLPSGIEYYYREKKSLLGNIDISGYDEELLFIRDNTKIDGDFQSEIYIECYKDSIKDWINFNEKNEILEYSLENVCILNIRGGEYKTVKSLLLPKSYWINAMLRMREMNSSIEFIAVTDDPEYVREILPKVEVVHRGISADYSIIKNARNLIISNSSFPFFPIWTSNQRKSVIAPKYWARFNISNGFWSCEKNLYKDWMWLDKRGNISTYEECILELEKYKGGNFRKLHLENLKYALKKIFNSNYL